jgi:hypothetical protein
MKKYEYEDDDPYIKYLKDNNIDKEGKTKYITQYINIDSSFRNISYEPQIEKSYLLVNNPLQFIQKNVRIYYNDTDMFQINDSVLLQNIEKKQLTIRSVIYEISGLENRYFVFNGDMLNIAAPTLINSDSKRTDAEITINNYEGDIRRELTLDLSGYRYSFDNYTFRIYTFDDELLADFDLDIYGTVIAINNNIIQDDFILPNNIYNTLIYFQNGIYKWIKNNSIAQTNSVGNISLSYINKTHNMIFNTNNFSVKLPKMYYRNDFIYKNPFNTNYVIFITYEEKICDVILTYEHYGGISIDNLTNTQYPITNISKNRFIDIFIDDIGNYTELFGGNNVSINKINYPDYYPLPNKYFINLEKTYTDIVKIKMVNSCFPKLHNNVNDGSTGNTRNNRLYWQIENEDKINMIEIDAGFYNDIDLQQILETHINDTDTRNNMSVYINKKTNTVKFQLNKILVNPSISITTLNDINNDRLTDMDFYIYPDGQYFKYNNLSDTYILTVFYSNHNVRLNDTIIISKIKYKVIFVTQNSFDIALNKINFNINDINVIIPVRFCLRFDFSYTLVKLLGFDNIITEYEHIITNNNKNILQEPPYILILCDEIPTNMTSITPNKNIFYKIDRYNDCYKTNDDYVYDSYVDTPIYYDEPLRKLNGLTLSYVYPDGTLFDFNKTDHSFVLEIITREEIPLNTHNRKT